MCLPDVVVIKNVGIASVEKELALQLIQSERYSDSMI